MERVGRESYVYSFWHRLAHCGGVAGFLFMVRRGPGDSIIYHTLLRHALIKWSWLSPFNFFHLFIDNLRFVWLALFE